MRNILIVVAMVFLAGCSRPPVTKIPSTGNSDLRVVVTDIDGTLTPNVASMDEVRPDAVKVMQEFSNRGYKIVYLSARVLMFQSMLPGWLEDNGFPDGELHLAQNKDDRRHPEVFKAKILNTYREKGWRLEFAFGDSTTDFIAYAESGIPKAQVFALRRSTSRDCKEGVYAKCLNGWGEYLVSL